MLLRIMKMCKIILFNYELNIRPLCFCDYVHVYYKHNNHLKTISYLFELKCNKKVLIFYTVLVREILCWGQSTQ